MNTFTSLFRRYQASFLRVKLATHSANQAEEEVKANDAKRKLNPYVEARREWNERYGDYINQAKNWRYMAVLSACISLVCAGGLSYIGAQNKLVPYVVEVDKLGQARTVNILTKGVMADPRIIKSSLGRFIQSWRLVTTDREVQTDAIKQLYALVPTGSAALQKFNDYFNANNPFKRAANSKISVELNSILPISQETWQIDWSEETFSLTGESKGKVRWRAFLTVTLDPPKEEAQILLNPFGVYVTDLNWAQQI